MGESASFGMKALAVASSVTIIVIQCVVFVCDEKQRRDNFIMNLKLNIKVLFGMWVVNLVVFTTCLWLGAYAVHNGVKWIEGPIDATLISTGIAKVILSALVFVGMSNNGPKNGPQRGR